MKALIFAAGLGTRLKPFTLEHPKALVPVGGMPMLGRVINNLKDIGISEIVVNVHHFADQIIDYLEKNNNFNISITISDERSELLDTGGGVLKARQWLDGSEPFIIHNADILTDVDILDMYKKHISSDADVTLFCSPRETARYFYFDRQSKQLVGWGNINTGETRPNNFIVSQNMLRLAFNGIHIMSPKVFDTLKNYTKANKFSISPFYIDNLQNISIKAYSPDYNYHWLDVGKPETLEIANNIFQ